MLELVIGACAVVVIVMAVIWTVRSGMGAAAPPTPAKADAASAPPVNREASLSPAATTVPDSAGSVQGNAGAPVKPAPAGTAAPGESATLERARLVVHALLESLSDSVESLLGDSTKYGDSLDNHKASIHKAKTITKIRELESVMLSELEDMQQANTSYRRKLDRADAKLKTQKKELAQLQSDVGLDFLTKIANRRALDSRVSEEMNRAMRYGGTFSLVIFDLDHFKLVNDRYGHLAGDNILRSVAALIEKHKRASDFIARYGGEEFVLLLPETTADRARLLAENTCKKLAEARFRFERDVIEVTASAGVGELLPGDASVEQLFLRVDTALYQAKQSGRNRVEAAPTRPA